VFETLPPTERVSLRGRRLQVVVQLTNVELTPAAPKYPGRLWRVEGMANESIVASVIICLSPENISESRLELRQACNRVQWEEEPRRWGKLCGLKRRLPLNQPLGSVLTQGGRAIAFPNFYQQHVAPFRLINSTQPGRQRLLIFHLVDPSRRVVSTAHVPPQQREWVEEYARSSMRATLADHLIPPLVHIVQEHALDFTANTVTRDSAVADRERFQHERSSFKDFLNRHNFIRPYSFKESD